ncbi:hypothetical protein [Bradyrhizobium retamae]|uniref:Uncharacterized protein n=1 Tax=Bradyrhizobium retamae TaxID=1300035 RepID=A0A0R3MQA2_9BRAD|nr:hypothetical protein [Bradyrhizobium retamae]KRR22139.1 hypothetical protein CQ13_29870 [Bradyrhizobium retamae]
MTSEYWRHAVEERARLFEAVIERFRECGVELSRFTIHEHDDTTYLFVDDVARFSVRFDWQTGPRNDD